MKLNIMTKTMGAALLLAVLVSCRENEFGTVDLTMPEKPAVEAQYTYTHPCAMFSDADFTRVKTMLDDGTAPQAVKDEFQNLKNSPYAALGRQAEPQQWIVRGDPEGTGVSSENYAYAMRDAAAAYQTAMLWILTGDAQYGDKSVEIMNAWADVCQGITSNDANQMLAAGAQGYTFANAAEIMQTYDGWAEQDKSDFKTWMVNVFASKNKEFLDHENPDVCIDHYWSNWDLVNMCSYLAIGILTENDDMVNFVVNYFHADNRGNGCIGKLMPGEEFDDPLGSGEKILQNQESGRDQGHAQMSLAVTANLCQMAYTLYQFNKDVDQLDFFAANDNAVMKMGEYVALCNLKDGTDNANEQGAWVINSMDQMPFTVYEYCQPGCGCRDTKHGAVHEMPAGDEQSGHGEVRPGWEILYNHYARTKGLGSGYKYAKQLADKMRPEGGSGDARYGANSGAFDQLGWGTLMLYQE